jgi:PAS domain S-box-containing protein
MAGQPTLARLALKALMRGDRQFREVLDALPAAIYTTDAEGRITYYNAAAAELWGRRPATGTDEFCGSWKLYWPDGTPLPHDECPMALALREKRANRGMEAVAERPDGTRVSFLPYPTPLFDTAGKLTGAMNMLIDITDRQNNEQAAQRLAAIVESSEDAILSKNLDGIITSWNQGAQRLFGYGADEIIGRPGALLIPEDRPDEEPGIIARIRRGERVDHYETVRRRKDGSLIDISLTVSPIKNAGGRIVGASKIARDITERRRVQVQQQLLLREMNHRVKNLLALSSSVVTLSTKSARTPQELAAAVQERLGALSRAHALTLANTWGGSLSEPATTLHALIQAIVLPYENADDGGKRVTVSGLDVPISSAALSSLALLLHEFATNAAKYGALSTTDGHIDVTCSEEGDQFVLLWKERGGPPVNRINDTEGFGTLLARITVTGRLGGEIAREWNTGGLTIRLSVMRSRLAG